MLKLLCVLLVAAVGVSQANDNDSLSNYIKALLVNFKQEMGKGIPHLNIPPLEPLVVPVLDVDVTQGVASIKLAMRNMIISQLSSFQVRHVTGDLQNLGLDIEMFFPVVAAIADYKLDGKIIIFPLFGEGKARLQVNDFVVKLKAQLKMVGTKIQLQNLAVDGSFSQVQVHLENIVGGGNLGDLINSVINMLGKIIFDKFRGQIFTELNRIAMSALNQELSKVNLQDILGGMLPMNTPFTLTPADNSANNYIDKVMENLRPHIKQNNLDPIGIPDQIARFSKQILFVTVSGSARIYNGKVNGLSTIHRAGDFSLQYEGSTVTIAGTIGLDNLFGRFDAHAEFMGIGIGAGVNLAIPRVRVFARISQNIQNGSPQLQQFTITEVSTIGVQISGLGPLDWIFGALSTVIVNAVKGEIIRAIENPVRQELIKVLQSIKIEF